MNEILTAVIPVVIIGIICGTVLVVASKLMAVREDEKYPKLRDCLPGANCGACGFAGCDGYARALCEKEGTPINLCVPGGKSVADKLSTIMGVEPAEVKKLVAVVHCGGDCSKTEDKIIYQGIPSCKAAKTLYGGKGSCVYGCLGLGDCVHSCPQHAISLENGVARVDPELCIGCGICTHACPNHLISLEEDVKRVVVTCSNKDKGALTRKVCTNGCIGCKKCEKVCLLGAIKVIGNIAVVDYRKCRDCPDFAVCVKNCTTHCLIDIPAGQQECE